MRIAEYIVAAAVAGSPFFAHAAGKMKPGLWEITIKSDALAQMPNIPPEQLEKMKQMGVQMPQMKAGGMVQQVCVSKEMAERDSPPGLDRQQSECKIKNQNQSGSTYTADMVCDGANMKGNATIKATYSGDSAFTSTYDFKGTAGGQPVSQHHETSGRWSKADCGNVKPATGR
ncbi:MAG: DUF3617 domain-containing protein [Burkholderiales bacterium]|nr:DUF3617 domain-containing protein [Burkholderiales bacterium]